jgi:CheY-like chemotaxis protein
MGQNRGIEIRFTLSGSTSDALERINKSGNFDAIISDAGRVGRDSSGVLIDHNHPEYNQAGYRLLKEVRKADDRIPFFIYSSSNEYKYKAELYARGGQGSTNDPFELLSLVLSYPHLR